MEAKASPGKGQELTTLRHSEPNAREILDLGVITRARQTVLRPGTVADHGSLGPGLFSVCERWDSPRMIEMRELE